MKYLIYFFMIVFLSSCAVSPAVKPVCRHWALFNAITYHDLTGKQVRIIVYPIQVNPNINHAEAYSLENDGYWYLLEYENEVKPTKIMELEPPLTYTIKEYIAHLETFR